MSTTINLSSLTQQTSIDDSITVDFSASGYHNNYDDHGISITTPTLSITDLSNSSSGYAYPNVWTTSDSISPTWTINDQSSNKIELRGENADIEINGESLMDAIHTIQKRLNILTVNPQLESEWEELREIGERYRALEKHILEKQATWDRLKAMPPPIID